MLIMRFYQKFDLDDFAFVKILGLNPANICLLKVNNKNTKKRVKHVQS